MSFKKKELQSLSLKRVQGPTASNGRCHGADVFTAVFQSIFKYCYSSPVPPPPAPREYERYWNDTRNAASPDGEARAEPPRPGTVLRRPVRLMDTYASSEAKRTPDAWEGIPRLE